MFGMIKFLFKSAVILLTLLVLFLISVGGLSDIHSALSVSDEESGAIFEKEDAVSWDTVQR